ncbi:FAD-binding oxidoreductase [Olivibacter sitiensis]|uniref:FAD-binding oxidoreductase n=1 Tax=Olivibacter sitiensis TaxID=376470 RepID=UPI0012F7F1D7|nr:FAD-binding oxidoreductase [Olivibacter sitiensis]
MISSIPKWVSNLFGNTMRPNVKVLETSYISSQIKKIRFQGDISKWSFQIGYASVVRVSETEFRNYTVTFHDKEKEIFEIIFHIHGNGVGSRYIDTLKLNDKLFISPPRGKKLYEKNVKRQFFFGDETSLGVAFALLPLLKKNNHQFQFYFELEEVNKNIPELLGLENYTTFPKNNSFRNEKWISNLSLFQTDEWDTANFALTGNVKSVQAFRKVLKDKTQGNIYSQGYWLEGKKGL